MKDALQMFVECIRWRREMPFEDLLYQGESVLPEWLNATGYAYVWKKSKAGRHVMFVSYGESFSWMKQVYSDESIRQRKGFSG